MGLTATNYPFNNVPDPVPNKMLKTDAAGNMVWSSRDSYLYIGSSAPTDTQILWIDISKGHDKGVAKYYDQTAKAWKNVLAVWG